MINKNIETHSWVSINKMNVEDLRKVLKHVHINRYATGGVHAANLGILDLIGDGSYWNKFVWSEFSGGKKGWRLGSVNESICEDKELQFAHMFTEGVNLKYL